MVVVILVVMVMVDDGSSDFCGHGDGTSLVNMEEAAFAQNFLQFSLEAVWQLGVSSSRFLGTTIWSPKVEASQADSRTRLV